MPIIKIIKTYKALLSHLFLLTKPSIANLLRLPDHSTKINKTNIIIIGKIFPELGTFGVMKIEEENIFLKILKA